MDKKAGLVLDKLPVCWHIYLESIDGNDDVLPFISLLLTRSQWLPYLCEMISFLFASTKYSLLYLMVNYLKFNVSLSTSTVEWRGLVPLKDVSTDEINFYSLWISLAEKNSVTGSMCLVADMETYEKKTIGINILILISPFRYTLKLSTSTQ